MLKNNYHLLNKPKLFLCVFENVFFALIFEIFKAFEKFLILIPFVNFFLIFIKSKIPSFNKELFLLIIFLFLFTKVLGCDIFLFFILLLFLLLFIFISLYISFSFNLFLFLFFELIIPFFKKLNSLLFISFPFFESINLFFVLFSILFALELLFLFSFILELLL